MRSIISHYDLRGTVVVNSLDFVLKAKSDPKVMRELKAALSEEEAIAFLTADGVKEELEEASKKPAARRGRKRKTTGN